MLVLEKKIGYTWLRPRELTSGNGLGHSLLLLDEHTCRESTASYLRENS